MERNTFTRQELYELVWKESMLSLSRRPSLFDTFIKALLAIGHSIGICNQHTEAIVQGHGFALFLHEKMRSETVQEGSWTRQVFSPTGMLALQVGRWGGREYTDGKLPLEAQLVKFVPKLELSADERTASRLAFEKAEAERRAKTEQERLLQERKEKELPLFKKLLFAADRWQKAQNLRQYIQEFECRLKTSQNLSPETVAWLDWARQKANWYDPFVNAPDELLADVDPAMLALPKPETGYRWDYEGRRVAF